MTSSAEWGVSTVSDEFEVQLGKRLDAAVNRGDLRRCINNRSVRWGRILVEESIEAPLSVQDIRNLRLSVGDVLMCEGGEVGRAAVWGDELPEAYFLNTLHRLRSKGDFDPRLLVAFFERWALTSELTAVVGKATLAHLTKQSLLRVPLPVPAPEEQARIVDALRDADNLITSLERLIAKKQAIKQGMMQQLLTGKTRLPGFTEPWSAAVVGDLADQHRRTVDPRRERNRRFQHFSLPAFDEGRASIHELGSSIDSIKFSVPQAAVLVSKLNPRIPRIWAPEMIGPDAVASTEFIVLIPKPSIDRSFLKWLMKSPRVIARMKRLATGTTGSHTRIHPRRVLSIEVHLPPEPEQIAIAAVLDDVDREIILLDERLRKARAIKTGMMQELLTGRTRLPLESVS